MSPRTHRGHATPRRPPVRPAISALAHASQRLALIGAAFAFVAPLLGTAQAAPAGSSRSVLILYSNQRPLPANVVIDETLRRVVPEALGRPVEMFSEFLDIEHFSSEGYADAVADFLRQKYGQRNVGVIVAAGSEALPFILGNRGRILPKVPVVHLNLTREDLRELAIPEDVIGWTVDYDLASAIALTSRLRPQARRLVFVSGTSAWDRKWERRLREAGAALMLPLQVEFIPGLPTPDVLRQLQALTPDAIVFTPGYFVDGAGAVFTPRQSSGQMAAASGAPIFSPYDTFLGNGIVGAYGVTFEDQSRHAGEVVVALLRGAAPGGIATGALPNAFILDWRQLQRWAIDESVLPADSVVRFREPGAWEKHRWQIIAVAVVLALQALLIAALLIERRRRRIAEVDARRRFAEMAHMNRSVALGALSASIAHEINQPLGAILNNASAAEMLLKKDPPALPDLAEILADIKRDDQRASEVVTRIRGLLRRTELEPEDIDLNAAVEEALKFVAADASVKGVSLRTELAAGLPAVRADRVQVEQVILNLALNAMDAMREIPADGRVLTVTSARANAAEAIVSVADTGPGLSTHVQSRMFEPFFTSKDDGMGLGLAISRTIVEAHGGRIWAEGASVGGAVFHFTVPIADQGLA